VNKSCIVCKSFKNKVVFQEFGIGILRCTNCGHVFSSYEFNQNYDGYFGYDPLVESEHEFFWNAAHKHLYNDFCQRFIVGKSGRLLDVGCGLGYFVKRLSDFPSWQVFGYEISRQAVDFARKELDLPNVFCGSVEDSNFDKASFDIITLWDVLEHIPHPDPLLSYLFSLLKEEGILFIHTGNAKIQLPKAKLKKLLWGMKPGSHYLEAKDHCHIYSMKAIKEVLCRNGFANVEFTHLKPIQGVAGSRNQFLKFMKNLWFYSSVTLFWMTGGHINLDNLFVIGRK
jgi:2-polyprenyl-3-methyl-5-hydroxy-6-metoxy-1,4-benzoquinol methylase